LRVVPHTIREKLAGEGNGRLADRGFEQGNRC
jgi:hypothetical protein